MGKDYVLAIDQGTTGTTVRIFDGEAKVVGGGYREFEQHFPKPGWVEHDPGEIFDMSVEVVQEALDGAGLPLSAIDSLGITNQRETTLMWDRQTSDPVARAIVWQDRRTASICDELRQRGLEDKFRGRTGLLLDPYFSGTKLKWYLDNIDGLRSRCEQGDIAFGTIDSWLIWKLTGGRVHATDVTNASRTLLYDIYERRWDEELLGILGIPAAVLPEVRPSSGLFGETDPKALLGASLPVAGVAGDQQAALFAQACYEEGMAKNTYGTGSFVLMNTGGRAVHSEGGLLTTVACGIAGEGVDYALEGSIFVTGAALQWLRDGIGIIPAAAASEELARSVGSTGDVYFVPALTGLGAPHWDPYARGLLIGLSRGTGRAHIARAALEAIAYQTRDVCERMEKDSGIDLKELRADGAAAANDFLMQFQSDILGVPVDVPEVGETTALGSAFMAGLATGFWGSKDELRDLWRLDRRFEPQMSESERESLHARWTEAVRRARDWSVKQA
jgi:glycerol kinase